MSRILKYRESLLRFIKDKSCLMEDSDPGNAKINSFIYSLIKEHDLIFPILLLTVMNSQNKKNHISMQGYYIASSIEFMLVLFHSIEHSKEVVSKLGDSTSQTRLTNNLILYANKSIQQNLESIKNVFHSQNLFNIAISSLNSFNNFLKIANSFDDFKFNVTNKSCNNDIVTWYLKNKNELIDQFRSFKQVSKESLLEYMEIKYVNICELAITLGWILGGGELKEVNKLKKSSRYFAIMYKISKDLENLDSDIKNGEIFTSNYVLNFGLQDGYELFLNNKQKFIEESMIGDTYTNTIKEIIDTVEANVDMIIDQTSPDLKSNYSSSKEQSIH